MSYEYLFEKQGSDIEIERLEGLLAEYRIGPVVPRLAEPETLVGKRGFLSWLRVGYAVAFATVLVVFGLSIMTVRKLDRAYREVVAVSPAETPVVDRSFLAPSVVDRASVNDIIPENESPVAVKKPRRVVPAVMRRERHTPASDAVAEKSPRLTKEEKYAYDQLMVALWITGLKLKVVQDTINRVDDRNSEPANDKR